MSEMTPRIRQMLRRADKIASKGKRTAAEQLYRELATEAPDVPDVWLGLAGVVRDEAERDALYNRVLEMDPDNETAKAGLAGELVLEPVVESTPIVEAVAEADHEHEFSAESQISQAIGNTEEAEEVGGLRCNKCGKPIDLTNSTYTSVGYRCNDCIRELEDGYFTATTIDYLLALTVAIPLSILGGFISVYVGFFVIFVAAAAGGLIGTAVIRVVSRRRGRYLPRMVAGCVFLCGLGIIVLISPSIWGLLYSVLAASSAYYRMR